MASGNLITIKNSLSDKGSFSAYHVRSAKSMVKGGIVILQEIFGLNGYIREVCDSFADDGFEVIAPALFDRAEKNIELGYDSDAVAKGLALKEAVDTYSEIDILTCAAHLSEQLKIAVIGYCWGGSLAWRMRVGIAVLMGLSAIMAGNYPAWHKKCRTVRFWRILAERMRLSRWRG